MRSITSGMYLKKSENILQKAEPVWLCYETKFLEIPLLSNGTFSFVFLPEKWACEVYISIINYLLSNRSCFYVLRCLCIQKQK
jgi:hypothetical protein